MYIVKRGRRYKTREGWTAISNDTMYGLDDLLKYTKYEAENNTLPKGEAFVKFPSGVVKDESILD